MNTRTTELVLVRHGEAIVNLTGTLDGVCHGLTDRGRTQAAALARRFAAQGAAAKNFDAGYHSPVRRAAETAGILQSAVCVPIVVHDGLRVATHGEPGVDPWDIATNSIGTLPTNAPNLEPAPGAETWQSYLDRCGQVLLDIVAAHDGQRVLIVAHAETAGGAAQAFLRLPAGNSRWFYPMVHHTGLTVWRHSYSDLPGSPDDGQWTLVSANDTGHLRDGEFIDHAA